MITKIEYKELPEAIAACYNSLDVKKLSKRTDKKGNEVYTVVTYRGGRDVWRIYHMIVNKAVSNRRQGVTI